MKGILIKSIKIILLTFVMFLIWSTASNVIGTMFGLPQVSDETASTAALFFLLVCFLNVVVLLYPLIYTKWSGIKLMVTVFIALFGIQTVMSQLETFFFNSAIKISNLELLGTILIGFLTALIFAPLLVLIWGKMKSGYYGDFPQPLFKSNREMFSKLLILSVLYLCLYFLFGYFVAWQFASLREFYTGSTEILNIISHLHLVAVNDTWLIPFQLFRGLLWVVLALPIIYMMRAEKWQKALAVGLLFSVLISSQLLIPNPYMPTEVRIPHLIETFTSNFIFGWLVVWVIMKKTRNYHIVNIRNYTLK